MPSKKKRSKGRHQPPSAGGEVPILQETNKSSLAKSSLVVTAREHDAHTVVVANGTRKSAQAVSKKVSQADNVALDYSEGEDIHYGSLYAQVIVVFLAWTLSGFAVTGCKNSHIAR
eukprot:scaffold569_cov408-Prasinococcus_capsulatus_cf.AAC.27